MPPPSFWFREHVVGLPKIFSRTLHGGSKLFWNVSGFFPAMIAIPSAIAHSVAVVKLTHTTNLCRILKIEIFWTYAKRRTEKKKHPEKAIDENNKTCFDEYILLFLTKVLVEVKKRFCCVEIRNVVNTFTKFQQNFLSFIWIKKIFSSILQ